MQTPCLRLDAKYRPREPSRVLRGPQLLTDAPCPGPPAFPRRPQWQRLRNKTECQGQQKAIPQRHWPGLDKILPAGWGESQWRSGPRLQPEPQCDFHLHKGITWEGRKKEKNLSLLAREASRQLWIKWSMGGREGAENSLPTFDLKGDTTVNIGLDGKTQLKICKYAFYPSIQ